MVEETRPDPTILNAVGNDMATVRTLFLEYAEGLGFKLCFQGFDAELSSLPGDYAPPRGALLIAWTNRQGGADAAEPTAAAGCVGLRPLVDGSAEIKRLFVRPAWRGRGLGRNLAVAVLDEAIRRRYPIVRLDTAAEMHAARMLYRSLGFVPTDSYYPDPRPGIDCFEKSLMADARAESTVTPPRQA